MRHERRSSKQFFFFAFSGLPAFAGGSSLFNQSSLLLFSIIMMGNFQLYQILLKYIYFILFFFTFMMMVVIFFVGDVVFLGNFFHSSAKISTSEPMIRFDVMQFFSRRLSTITNWDVRIWCLHNYWHNSWWLIKHLKPINLSQWEDPQIQGVLSYRYPNSGDKICFGENLHGNHHGERGNSEMYV